MQVKTTQVGGTGQAATVIDSEALGLQITQLESLYNTWLDTDVDGKTYYLWIINDLKTRNKASEVRIESVDKTTQNR